MYSYCSRYFSKIDKWLKISNKKFLAHTKLLTHTHYLVAKRYTASRLKVGTLPSSGQFLILPFSTPDL